MALPILLLVFLGSCKEKEKNKKPMTPDFKSATYTETYRPQLHFSPPQFWMNDPNGLIYHKGKYHLFYQYYPEDIKWGPMHWGHAVSTDLVHWQHKPTALFPDEHGYIFSGSVVLDFGNTSGLGSAENPPMVAIFTYHDAEAKEDGAKNYETQGLAYSLDDGETWEMYKNNPVLPNDGMEDFRDPKVFWDASNNAWVMSIVAGDHLQLWNSSDLKSWKKLSNFGKRRGAHGGVWECPDLFKMKVGDTDEEKWVLLISINPGGPNGGSATQYFVGDFDGQQFTSEQQETQWVDWGTDNYAGVTYFTLPKDYYGDTYENDPGQDRIFIGWMNNWDYGQETPTTPWRGAMTVPRKLSLQKVAGRYMLYNYPVPQLEQLKTEVQETELELAIGDKKEIKFDGLEQSEVRFTTESKDFVVKLKNAKNEEVVLTMNSEQKLFLLDRVVSGKTDFNEKFANQIQQMPVAELPEGPYEVRMLNDRSSIEVFINKGQYTMTAQLFPTEPYDALEFENVSETSIRFDNIVLAQMKTIW